MNATLGYSNFFWAILQNYWTIYIVLMQSIVLMQYIWIVFRSFTYKKLVNISSLNLEGYNEKIDRFNSNGSLD